jgi:ABC-type uncharacterized transport system substrate-binding protein
VGRLLVAVGVLIFASTLARAAGVVILGSERVAEHKEAIAAARQTAPELSLADEDSPDAAEQLRHADVVLAVGARALTMARTVAPATPIVYALVPAAEAQPGKLVTGVTYEVPAYAQFAQWRQLRYDGSRIGMLYSAAPPVTDAKSAAAMLGLTLVLRAVVDPAKVPATLAELGPQIDALWLPPERMLFSASLIKTIAAAALAQKVALLGFSEECTAAGALASMAPDARDSGHRAARIALGIAARPADQRSPVPPPATSPGSLTLNASTAQALGIDLPETLLKKARKVYH